MKRCAALTVALVITVGMSAQSVAQSNDVQRIAEKDVPRSVVARLKCSTPAGDVSRRAFAGGVVFSQPCTAGGETQDRLVFATDQAGANARLLQFHRPEGRRVSALGNVEFAAGSEISGTVGRLSRRICKAEGRWRMEGKQPSPALIYWRQTRDCDGKTGWQVMLNRKR